MGLSTYQRLQLRLGTKQCGCKAAALCPQHVDALPRHERRAYLAQRAHDVPSVDEVVSGEQHDDH